MAVEPNSCIIVFCIYVRAMTLSLSLSPSVCVCVCVCVSECECLRVCMYENIQNIFLIQNAHFELKRSGNCYLLYTQPKRVCVCMRYNNLSGLERL